jgi:prevent-host-death family protein
MNVTEARKQFSETLDRVRRRETRVVVEKSGIPVGAVVSMDDLARLKRIDQDRAALLETLAETRRAFEGVPADEIEAEIERAIAEVEAERRAKRLSPAAMPQT